MASEEKERAENGTTFVHAVSASAFLLLGIEIETLQLVFSCAQSRICLLTNFNQQTGPSHRGERPT